MKEVRILRLTLENFKGAAYFSLDLSGRSCTVYGGNGAGKSTIYDAFTWLLFGKDSGGDAKFELQPHDREGNILDPRAISAVEAALDVGGETVTLRRTYYEKWSRRRGGPEVRDGHSSDFFVDGVPVKKYAFEEAVARIADENLFRLLTNVHWFCQGMNWRDRRAVLFQLGQVESDRDILESRSEFRPLLEAMGRLGLEDFRKKLQAERKGLVGVRNDVPVRLDECRKSAAELRETDYGALELERHDLAARLEEARADLLRLGHGALLEKRRNQAAALRGDLAALERENRDHRRDQERDLPDVQRLRWDQAHSEAALRSHEARLAEVREDLVRTEQEIEGLRARWKAVNGEAFDGAVCPVCRRPLEGELLAEAETAFRAKKRRELDALVAESDRRKGEAANLRLAIARWEEMVETERARLEQLEGALRAAETQAVPITDLPDYKVRRGDLSAQLEAAEAEVRTLETDGAEARAVLQRMVEDLEGRVRRLDGELAKRALLASTEERMEALRREAAEAEARLEKLDALADLIGRFVRYKAERTEERVNERFETVRWRLFEEQVNGGLAECCEAVVGGSAYNGGLNAGARCNTGMEVIDVLSRHYGVRVPLVVDNAESVTDLRRQEGQVVRLVVSERDETLRVEMEAR